MQGREGSVRVPLVRSLQGSLCALQLIAQHNSGLLDLQSRCTLTQLRLHLHMKGFTESGDRCTQPAAVIAQECFCPLPQSCRDTLALRRRQHVPVLEDLIWKSHS